MKNIFWKSPSEVLARISRENVENEYNRTRDIVLSDSNTLNMLSYVYEELNILDKKMVQLLAFDGGILVANGLLLRMIRDVPKGHNELIIISAVIATISTLLSAIPGVVWGTSWAMRHQETKGKIEPDELK